MFLSIKLVSFLFIIFVGTSNELNWMFEETNQNKDFFKSILKCAFDNCTDCPANPGEPCNDCCKSNNNLGFICFNGKCQNCFEDSQWKCSSHPRNQDMLMTATQIAMSAALILGIITIFTLFWKICTATNEQRLPRRRNRQRIRTSSRSGRSVDSLQQVVSERLRDAPPPYTRATLPPPGDTPPPYVALASAGHINPSFDPDYNAAPPSYNIIVNQQNQTLEDPNTKVNTESNDDKTAESSIPDTTLHI